MAGEEVMIFVLCGRVHSGHGVATLQRLNLGNGLVFMKVCKIRIKRPFVIMTLLRMIPGAGGLNSKEQCPLLKDTSLIENILVKQAARLRDVIFHWLAIERKQ